MTRRDDALRKIGQEKVIAIIRGIDTDHAGKTIEALQEGGISCLEITMNTAGAIDVIEQACMREGLLVGAGTVLDLDMARASIDAGARFVLSPILDEKVIEYCLSRDVLPVPGVLTPTELYRAHEAGAPLIKVFPAGPVGPRYIKDLLGPFDAMKLMPVGGVSLENVAQFMEAGAFAVGIGSYLANPSLANEGWWKEIARRAKAFRGQVDAR